jgi:hypothetical protein
MIKTIALDGTPSLFTVNFDLASVGYAVREHIAAGTATSYETTGARRPDGRWEAQRASAAAFTTRFVVYQPTDAARANGTVVVEWLNVTGGLDIPAIWMASHRHLIRDGYTWVGVSAQYVGVESGGMMPGLGLRDTDAARYGELHHPGDAFAFDIFTQVAEAVREQLAPGQLVATGASQSAFYLTTYVNAIDRLSTLFDGYLLQGRAGAGVPVEGMEPLTIETATDPAARQARIAGSDQIRADVRVPVMVVQSETDVLGALAYVSARQPDSEHFRLWEVAGASHADAYFLNASAQDSGALSGAVLTALISNTGGGFIPTELPINSGPQMHYILQRAFDALTRWIRSGDAPASAERLAVDDNGALGVDDLGIGRGGVRSPWVDAPTCVLSGLGQPGAMLELFGVTRPFDADVLAQRYPGGRDEYVAQFRAATRAAVDAGFLLAADAPEVEAIGAASWPGT